MRRAVVLPSQVVVPAGHRVEVLVIGQTVLGIKTPDAFAVYDHDAAVWFGLLDHFERGEGPYAGARLPELKKDLQITERFSGTVVGSVVGSNEAADAGTSHTTIYVEV